MNKKFKDIKEGGYFYTANSGGVSRHKAFRVITDGDVTQILTSWCAKPYVVPSESSVVNKEVDGLAGKDKLTIATSKKDATFGYINALKDKCAKMEKELEHMKELYEYQNSRYRELYELF